MLIGLDFDNTMVCYDRLFHRLAIEYGYALPPAIATKSSVRDHLRAAGHEEVWTELQGIAYGPRIVEAETFPGVHDFLSRCRLVGVSVAIISHKTRRPYRGAGHDLHAAAHSFLESHGFYKRDETGLTADQVFFETTLPGKLTRIEKLPCSAFVDDLPELLAQPAFPNGVQRVLFDPSGQCMDEKRFVRVSSWHECGQCLLA